MYADVGADIGIDIASANLRMKATGKTRLIAAAIEDESLQIVPEIQFQVQAKPASPNHRRSQ